MRKITITFSVFLIVLSGFVFSGCTAMQYRSAARQRRRRHAIERDFYHLSDDIDWVLGIHRPSTLYDETLR